ncbi:MAG: hypothetical protein NTZ11_12185, partial [Gammaproteobacteria bacterium]|nr:hypothetical protein [Gammaproteobacteria bacterium]
GRRLAVSLQPPPTTSRTRGVAACSVRLGNIIHNLYPRLSLKNEDASLMLSGIYRILRNDTDKSDGFRIKIEEISSGETLSVDVPAALPFAQRELISAAEWKKTPIALNIDAEKFRDVIRKATVTSAAIPPDAKQLVAE